MLERVDVVFVHIQQAETVQWYETALGLSLGRREGHWTEFGMSGGVRFALDRISDSPSEVERQSILVSFRVDSLAEAVRELQARGVRFFEGPSGVIQGAWSWSALLTVGPRFTAVSQGSDLVGRVVNHIS